MFENSGLATLQEKPEKKCVTTRKTLKRLSVIVEGRLKSFLIKMLQNCTESGLSAPVSHSSPIRL